MNKLQTTVLAVMLLLAMAATAQDSQQRSNIYNMSIDDVVKRFATFKKTAATKVFKIGKTGFPTLGFFYEGRALAQDANLGTYVIDTKGNILKTWDKNLDMIGSIPTINAPHFSSGRMVFIEVTKPDFVKEAVIYDLDMHEVARFKNVSSASQFVDGIALITQVDRSEIYAKKTTFFIDVNGNRVLQEFSNLYAGVDGEILPSYIRPLREGLSAFGIPVQEGRIRKTLWGFRDKAGKVIIQPKYTVVHNFVNGLCAVRTGNNTTSLWGFIDTNGNEVIPLQFAKEPSDFDECGVAVVQDSERKYRLLNRKGEMGEERMLLITAFNKGRAIMADMDGIRMVDNKLNVITLFNDLPDSPLGGVKSVVSHNAANYMQLKGIYIQEGVFMAHMKGVNYPNGIGSAQLDANGNVVMAGLSGPFVNGIAPVICKNLNEIGYVNEKGEWVVKYERGD